MADISSQDISVAMSSLRLSENMSASVDPEMAVVQSSTRCATPVRNCIKKEDEELAMSDDIHKKDDTTVIICPKRGK
ncbi:hypothetical protein FRC10_012316 [Ceratobasidium sp. 414]|nr:hypothetical protein FRC10_012316 [Ceratobasidium sp. 414]